jgi:hypothetical protein
MIFSDFGTKMFQKAMVPLFPLKVLVGCMLTGIDKGQVDLEKTEGISRLASPTTYTTD